MRKRSIHSTIQSCIITFPLSVLSIVLFFIGKNIDSYAESSFLTFIFITLAFCGIAIFIGIGVRAIWRRGRLSKSLWASTASRIFFINFTMAVAWYLLLQTQTERMGPSYYLSIALSIFIANALVILIGFKPVNLFFIFWILISCVTSAWQTLFNSPPVSDIANISVDMMKRPNIYLFVLESYNDMSMMDSIYNIDTSGFRHFLDQNDFVVYNNVYSNHSYTLGTLSDIFGMSLYQSDIRGKFDDVHRSARDLIGGDKKNIALDVLKKNGYYTSMVTRDDPYYIFGEGQNLDKSDIDKSFFARKNLKPIYDWLPSIRRITDPEIYNQYNAPLEKYLWPMWEDARKNQPFFLYFKGGANHAQGASWKNVDVWMEKYKDFVEKSNQQIEKITKKIIESDPEALVILIGDHGSRRFNSINSLQVKTDINMTIKRRGGVAENVAKDYSNIFMAVRTGRSRTNISYGYVLSPVNLFHHVFAYLGDKPDILKNRARSLTNINGFIAVCNGVPLASWIPQKDYLSSSCGPPTP